MDADTLRRRRIKLGWTQDQLAARLGVHKLTLTRWEIGTLPLPAHGLWLDLALQTLEREESARQRRRSRTAQIA